VGVTDAANINAATAVSLWWNIYFAF